MFGGNGEIRTHTLLRMKEVHNRYATLPYRNTLACRTTTNSTGTPLLIGNVFLYGDKLMLVGFEPTPASAIALTKSANLSWGTASALPANTPSNLSYSIAVEYEQSCTI